MHKCPAKLVFFINMLMNKYRSYRAPTWIKKITLFRLKFGKCIHFLIEKVKCPVVPFPALLLPGTAVGGEEGKRSAWVEAQPDPIRPFGEGPNKSGRARPKVMVKRAAGTAHQPPPPGPAGRGRAKWSCRQRGS
jgi:hypothetical protein